MDGKEQNLEQGVPQNVPQDSPVAPPEAPEGVSTSGEPSNGPMIEKMPETALHGLAGQNIGMHSVPTMEDRPLEMKNPKKSHKGLIITLIAVVVLAVAGVLCWFFLINKPNNQPVQEDGSSETDKNYHNKGGNSDGMENGSGGELTKVDVNSEEFKKTFGNFEHLMIQHHALISINYDGPLTSENITDRSILMMTLNSLKKDARFCGSSIDQDLIDSVARQYAVEAEPDYYAQYLHEFDMRDWSWDSCLRAEDVRLRVKEMFDREIEIENGAIIAMSTIGGLMIYLEQLDAFIPWPHFGGGNLGPIFYLPYSAQKDSDSLIVNVAFGSCETETYDGCDNLDYVNEHLDDMAMLQWIFKKTSEGKYVFQSVNMVTE